MQETCMVVEQRGGGSSQGDDQPSGTFYDGDGDERVQDAIAPDRPSSDHSSGSNGTAAEDEDISSMAVSTVKCQTRIRLKDIMAMISLNNVYEGCPVLVTWNPTHGAYMVFTTSSMLYFVKESSHARLGIGQAEPRRNWVFAFIKSTETCQIRKDTN